MRMLLLMLVLIAVPAHAAELLVGNKAADTVWRLSLENGRRLGEFATGIGPHEIAVSADGRRAAVANYGRAQAGNTLTVVELDGDAAPRTIDLGRHGRPHGMRFLPDSDRTVLVTTEASGALLQVDLERGRIERTFEIGTGTGHMVAVAADGRTAYVAKIAAGAVVRVDLDSGEVIEQAAGAGAEGIALRPGAQELWVSNRDAGTVTIHDPATLAVRATLPSEGFPIRVAFTSDGRLALVTNAKAGTLAVFDARKRRRLATVALARADREYKPTLLGRAALPIGVIAHPSRPLAYVAIAGGDEIAVVDLRKYTVIDRWPTGREPDALAIGLSDGAGAR
ncbi:MAG TPA: gluconolaconase [Lysobacter sp.]|nr:gluconolaconase [Lysobacter sp.]